jgi:hypothetical protein
MKGTNALLTGIMMATGFSFLLTPGIADAASLPFLYWASPQVKTNDLSVCFRFAEQAMGLLNFQNIQIKQFEVTGTSASGGVYASITCLQTSPAITAVVMAVGENGSETAQVRDDLSKEVSEVTGATSF